MSEEAEKSRVFYNPDGYVEMTLAGTLSTQQIRVLAEAAKLLIEEYGPIGGLIDGRRGNIIRNVETLSILRTLQFAKLKRLVILTTQDNPEGIKGPTVVMSLLTSILGFRPIYIDDETEARRLAAQ
jgi:hypothetical protein